jgi:hypothetical protein
MQKSAGVKSGEHGKYSSVVTLCFAKKSLTKSTGVLENSREGKPSYPFSIFRGVSFCLHQ